MEARGRLEAAEARQQIAEVLAAPNVLQPRSRYKVCVTSWSSIAWQAWMRLQRNTVQQRLLHAEAEFVSARERATVTQVRPRCWPTS